MAKLKDQLRQLEAKYQTTLGARDTLIARQRRASAQRQVAEAIVVFTPLDPSSELDRMERKIRSEEAHAMAALEVGDESFEASSRPSKPSRRRGRARRAQGRSARAAAKPHLGNLGPGRSERPRRESGMALIDMIQHPNERSDEIVFREPSRARASSRSGHN